MKPPRMPLITWNCAIRGRFVPLCQPNSLTRLLKVSILLTHLGTQTGGGKMKNLPARLLCALFVVLFNLNLVWGQGSTAQITGSVTDPSGAVLPGVEVTATQTETAVSRTAVSNEAGAYVLPNLPVGPYRLEAGLPGFRTFAQTGIVLPVNSNPSINIVL